MGDVFESTFPEEYYVGKISDLEFELHEKEELFKQTVIKLSKKKFGDVIVTVSGGMVQGLDATDDFPEGTGVVINDMDSDNDDVIPYYCEIKIHETNSTLHILEEIAESYDKSLDDEMTLEFKEVHDEYYNRK